mgnify:FL=1
MNNNFRLTTEEAIKLIEIMKERVRDSLLQFPNRGEKLEFDVIGKDDGTKFIVNINRGTVDINKCTYQGRTFINSIPLMRLDITNSIHVNSDGTKIVGNHIHIYNENTEMRDAIPFDIEDADLYNVCLRFFEKFNIMDGKIICQMEIGKGK